MDKKFRRKENNTTKISYGKIGKKPREYDLETETIKKKRKQDK